MDLLIYPKARNETHGQYNVTVLIHKFADPEVFPERDGSKQQSRTLF